MLWTMDNIQLLSPSLFKFRFEQFLGDCRSATVNRCIHKDGARLDVALDDFWGSRHLTVFINVKVFDPNAPSYKTSSLSSLYRQLEKEKQRKYEQRICVVEMGCFTPLVFSTFGGTSAIKTCLIAC